MIMTAVVLLAMGFDGTISRIDSLILLGFLGGYMYSLTDKEVHHLHEKQELKRGVFFESLIVVIGIGVLLLSSYFVLKIIEEIVIETSLGGSLIGILSIGIASALPEVSASISGIKIKLKELV